MSSFGMGELSEITVPPEEIEGVIHQPVLANSVEAVQDGRIHIEKINGLQNLLSIRESMRELDAPKPAEPVDARACPIGNGRRTMKM